MKTRLLTLVLLLAASLSSMAQDKQQLKIYTQRMIDVASSGDDLSLIDLMYPRIFSIVTKEEVLSGLEKRRNGKDYTMTLGRTEPSIDYGMISKTDGGQFCIITYNTYIKLMPKEPIPAKKLEAETKRFKDLLKVEDISYNEANNVFEAYKRVQAIAITDAETNQMWKFVLLDGSPYVDKVLHEDIRTAIQQQ